MLKPFLSLLLAMFAGWMLHSLYLSTDVQKSANTTISLKSTPPSFECQDNIVEKFVTKEVIKFVPQIKIVYKTKKVEDENNASKDLFLLYLKEKKFYEAMDYYEEADEEKHPLYKSSLLNYFNVNYQTAPHLTIDQMRYFINIEPKSRLITFQLANFFEKKRRFKEALAIIIEWSYGAAYGEKNAVNTKIKSISTAYISLLYTANNFKELIDFLNTQINIGILSNFYEFELAKVYLKLKKYMQAIEHLETLKDDDIYKNKANEMLAFIELKLEEQQEYPTRIPLVKRGLHFYVKAYANNIPLFLLVDTGASITSVNQSLINHLPLLKKGVSFQTAGGVVKENIFQTKSFTVDSITLEHFSLVGSTFESKNIDGLLGMNFLGKFKFKIDQKEAILYLGRKY